MLNSTVFTSDPNVLDVFYKVDRISRGVYGLSGYLNISVDLNDENIIKATLYRSNSIDGPFVKVPMGYTRPLGAAMNEIYKNSCMKTMQKCTISGNAPYVQSLWINAAI